MLLSSRLRETCFCVLFTGLLLVLLPHATTAVPPDEALATVDSLRSHGQFRRALHRLDSLAQAHPQSVAVHWHRALLLADQGKAADDETRKETFFHRSLRASDRALSLDSTSAWAHLTASLAEARLTLYVGTSERVHRSRAVKQHADRAVALDSTLAPAYHIRGRWHRDVANLNFLERTLVKTLYDGLPDASFAQSVQNLERAIALESKPYNHLELAKTYLAMGRTDAARSQLLRCLNTSGSPFDAEYHREARALLSDLD